MDYGGVGIPKQCCAILRICLILKCWLDTYVTSALLGMHTAPSFWPQFSCLMSDKATLLRPVYYGN